MNIGELKNLINKIVKDASLLKNEYTDEKNAPVNYACIFSQNNDQFDLLVKTAKQIGKIIKETETGPLFQIYPLETICGQLKLLKIRRPDKTRFESGDADFTIKDFRNFKKKYGSQKFFKLIKREDFEMVELANPGFNVRAYFSNPPLDKQLIINYRGRVPCLPVGREQPSCAKATEGKQTTR